METTPSPKHEELDIKIRCLEPKSNLLVEELNITMRSEKISMDGLIQKALKLKEDLVIKKK